MNSKKNIIPVIDIFAGPGGLGEGFLSFSGTTEKKNNNIFKICLSIEKDKDAYNTLKLRSFYRKFTADEVPDAYYELEYDKRSKNFNQEELYKKYSDIASAVDDEVRQCELGSKETSAEEVDTLIRSALDRQDKDHWVLIGGPPCQAYSTVGRSRNRGNGNYIPEKDHRHFLYREYLRIVSHHWPSIFVMENVKGILTSKVNGQPIFSKILSDLSNPADSCDADHHGSTAYRYRIFSFVRDPLETDRNGFPLYDRPHDFIIESEKFGIPQARHRVILLGIREDLDDSSRKLLQETDQRYNVMDILNCLPELRSGLSKIRDSADNWQDLLLEVINAPWLASYAESEHNADVCNEIYKVLHELLERTPKFDRGGEQLSFTAGIDALNGWYLDRRMSCVFNSSTRGHLGEDLYRYLFSSCFARVHGRSPVLMDFPPGLLPRHKNAARAAKSKTGNFADRFRVQLTGRPATTIMSHISKDGHYYIHPDPFQCRSLTVREAARLQTFPDNYIFTGSRTQQYVQVGNAVPPLLATKLAKVVSAILLNN